MRLIIEFDEQKGGVPRITSDVRPQQQNGGACRHVALAAVRSTRRDGAKDGGAANPQRRR